MHHNGSKQSAYLSTNQLYKNKRYRFTSRLEALLVEMLSGDAKWSSDEDGNSFDF